MTKPSQNRGIVEELLSRLDNLSGNTILRRGVYTGAFLFFIIMILVPPLIGILLKWNLIGDTLGDPTLVGRAQGALVASFAIALFVSLLDLLAGIPMAWLIVRKKGRWVSIIDTLADVPFIVPTVTLGYSVLTFWSQPGGISGLLGVERLFSPGPALIVLLHFAFSYPVIVRLMVGEFQGYNQVYETAARTLGASTFTAFRTVTMPILKPALISAFLLAFSRSLSETGATAIVSGTFENGPVFIRNARSAGQEGPMILVSSVLIGVSVTIFAVISLLGPRLKLPTKKVWTGLEWGLSSRNAALAKDASTLILFALFVAVPSLFVAFPSLAGLFDGTLQVALSGTGVWTSFWSSLANSYVVALLATFINLLIGFPMAIIIARRKLGPQLTAIMDGLVAVPVIIPSVALGVSLSIFWSSLGNIPEFWVLVLAHSTITYTYLVRPMAAAIQGVSEELEEVGRTLGSRPFGTFRKIVMPLTKYSIFSSSVMVLTRSVAETGATIAVVKRLQTAPVLLVDWIRNIDKYGSSTVGLGILFLILVATASLLAIRLAVRGGRPRIA